MFGNKLMGDKKYCRFTVLSGAGLSLAELELGREIDKATKTSAMYGVGEFRVSPWLPVQ